MSGIYIPGMEMPKCCYDCELIDIVTSCPHYDLPSEAYCQIDYIRKRRDKDCPLIAVPDHGRLIDADALKERLKTAMPTYPLSGCRTYADTNIPWYINNAPTIIESEE